MTAPDRIDATTEQGTGMILPIAKALTHVMTVYTAITREWPLSTGDALAELSDASAHLTDAVFPYDLMTEATAKAIDGWIGQLNAEAVRPTTDATEETPLADAINEEQLKKLATDTWQLLTILDRELTGLTTNQADPGLLP